ncbi:glycoside hydrolase family 172 protein [Saccharopolyspora gloriosae]|uniref:glycoside hydrolase family 172 protein n=1 Tax=Saccharopolyspora gloriosae TaxID=455344 RepID=UPI001FB7409C|nr:glycoside hydrolase family 172 protein [Saccharopolyspora gloriosae]
MRDRSSDALRTARRLPRRFGAFLGVASLAAAAMVADSGYGPAQASSQASAQQRAAGKGSVGWDTYREPGGLAQLRGSEQTGQFSSFARDGSNDDGFHGTFSCLRNGDRGCVIAERAGAGEISSIWFTREPWGDVTGTGNIVIELDGRTVLDAPLIDVVSGRVGAPFEWPLVGNADDSAGGAVIKVPMPYRESMRVTVENNPDFYHVDYRSFGDAEGVETFDPEEPAEDVLARLRMFGVADPKDTDPESEPTRRDFGVVPGTAAPVAQIEGPGQINELRLRIPQVAPSPRVVDDGRAFGEGGGSRFDAAVAPDNEGVRIVRRSDPQVADQVASLSVDGAPAGEWRSGPAAPGGWAVQAIDVPAELTAGKSSVEVASRFVSSSLDVNEFRYDVQSLVNGEWVRTDVLDVGPAHPGEEAAHGYRIDNPVFAREKLLGRYGFSPEEVAASEHVLESARLRITFDGKTTVDAPIGEFFGSGLGEHDVRSMMTSIDPGDGGWYTSWWPMPFSKSATVEIVNGGGIPIENMTAEVSAAPKEIDDNTGYFNATHHRGRTVEGQDWNFLDAKGSGTFYGVTHTMRGLIPPNAPATDRRVPLSLPETNEVANQRNYLEGDERFYVNGEGSPAWHGTGSEDYYESGWYFRDGTTFSMPLAGNPAHELNGDGCQYDCTGAYRLQVPDAVPFNDGLIADIEHGPNNDEPGDYSSTAYWYGGHPVSQEKVDDIDLSDQGSRDSHGYTADGETVEPLRSRFEGTNAEHSGEVAASTGPVSFDVALGEDNAGARLRRLSDQAQAYQQVEVRVDGESAGTWLQALGNGTHRWLEDGFELPAALTEGKDQVRVELVPAEGAAPWTASQYTVFKY